MTQSVVLTRVLLFVVAFCWCACSKGRGPTLGDASSSAAGEGANDAGSDPFAGDGALGHRVEFHPPPPRDLASFGYPKTADGSYILAKLDGLELRLDPSTPPSPMTVRSQCSDWLTQCYGAPGGNLDDCFFSVPRCQTERPWEENAACCPEACVGSYVSARRTGNASVDAFLSVFAGDRGGYCVPGYARWLAGETP